jgi:hypothetical protein
VNADPGDSTAVGVSDPIASGLSGVPDPIVAALASSTATGAVTPNAHRGAAAPWPAPGPPTGPGGGPPFVPWRARAARAVASIQADRARATAIADCWRALWTSRLLIWLAGLIGVAALGPKPSTSALDPRGLTSGFGWLASRLLAPAARWDSAWYLVIAQRGYRVAGYPSPLARSAFFPLYPLLIAAVGDLGAPLVVAGLLVSLVAFVASLYGLHRLTTLELAHAHGPDGVPADAARLAVLACAFFPMAFFFSAVYSESLYLALTLGVFWCARRGRWGWACVLGALASATRNSGVIVIVPIALLYLYGPRDDRPPDRPGARWLIPRYRLRWDVSWLALVPAGAVAFTLYTARSSGDALLSAHAQTLWHRQLLGPLAGLGNGLVAAFDGIRQLVSGQNSHVYFTAGHGDPRIAAQHNIVTLAFLLGAVIAIIGVARTLPLAYAAYCLLALLVPLSEPVSDQPLMSMPRFIAVLFPLYMWAGVRLAARPRLRAPLLLASAAGLVIFAVQFATWHWVA